MIRRNKIIASVAVSVMAGVLVAGTSDKSAGNSVPVRMAADAVLPFRRILLPVFRKFDILALQRRQARHNEMGLFCLNGIYYIRTLFQEKGECRLRSLNVIDEDILVKEADEFHCIGTVLGQVNAVLET